VDDAAIRFCTSQCEALILRDAFAPLSDSLGPYGEMVLDDFSSVLVGVLERERS
jgi:hypothetical protein